MKNVNVTAPGGDGNPGAGKKHGLSYERKSRHVSLHQRAVDRMLRAGERIARRENRTDKEQLRLLLERPGNSERETLRIRTRHAERVELLAPDSETKTRKRGKKR